MFCLKSPFVGENQPKPMESCVSGFKNPVGRNPLPLLFSPLQAPNPQDGLPGPLGSLDVGSLQSQLEPATWPAAHTGQGLSLPSCPPLPKTCSFNGLPRGSLGPALVQPGWLPFDGCILEPMSSPAAVGRLMCPPTPANWSGLTFPALSSSLPCPGSQASDWCPCHVLLLAGRMQCPPVPSPGTIKPLPCASWLPGDRHPIHRTPSKASQPLQFSVALAVHCHPVFCPLPLPSRQAAPGVALRTVWSIRLTC